MFRNSHPNHSAYQALIPIAIGLLGFFLVAGVSILDVKNIAWLGGALDPAQHYLGWALYQRMRVIPAQLSFYLEIIGRKKDFSILS